MTTIADIMTPDPVCCTPDDPVSAVARRMAEKDIGSLPVIEGAGSRRVVGMITDRDIACRVVAEGKDPDSTTARQAMTDTVITVGADTTIDTCSKRMRERQIRRVPVVDEPGVCVGIVAQADIARSMPEPRAGEVVREISRPNPRTANTL